MASVSESKKYNALYDNYLRVCKELTRISLLNEKLTAENDNLRQFIESDRLLRQFIESDRILFEKLINMIDRSLKGWNE